MCPFSVHRDEPLAGDILASYAIPFHEGHIADRSVWIKIDDAGVFGTTFQRAARQRDSAFISEVAGPTDLVDGDLDAFVDIDVAVIKDQIVERGVLLVSGFFNLGERLARLEQSQELARGHARAAGDDSMAALAVSRHGGRCTRLQESCKTEGN